MNRRWLQVRRWWVERQHHLSRAFTIKHARTGRQETYVVCVDCGLEYEYDLATMRITGRPMARPAEQPDAVALERAWQDQPKPAAEKVAPMPARVRAIQESNDATWRIRGRW